MTDMTLRQLLQAGVHFGHQTRYWSPKMAPYIFGDRNKIHIINLEKTLPMMKEAMNYLGSVVGQGGNVLFVGTKRQAGTRVREHAQRCGMPFVDKRWLGGMLTNFKTVKNSIARLKELEQRIDSGATARLSKKEALSLERERAKLDKTLSGIKDMNGLPDCLFVIDVEHEYIAVAEANKLGIPVVAVVDSNCNPKGIDYIIPGNDDSARAIELYVSVAADAVAQAREAARAVRGIVPGDDEYVEVDESGEVVPAAAEPDAAAEAAGDAEGATEPAVEDAAADDTGESTGEEPAAEAAPKKVTKKKVTRKKAAEKPAADEGEGAEGKAAKKVAKKKVTKKKVTKKKVAKKAPEAAEGE